MSRQTIIDANVSIYTELKKLKDLAGFENVSVYQKRPDVISGDRVVTFEILGDVPVYSVQGDVEHQDVNVQVDIWTQTPKDGSAIAIKLEEIMYSAGGLMERSVNSPDEDGSPHKVLEFNLLV